MHFFNSNFSWVGFLNIFLVGILFSQFFLMKNNLSIPIGFHFGWNFIQGPILGFSVSGFPTNSVIEVVDNSYHEFNFGGFGLEGSLACTSILICLIALIFFLHTKKAIKFYMSVGNDK